MDDRPCDTRPWCVNTARRRHIAVFWFYEWARCEGFIGRNPTEFVELPPRYPRRPFDVANADIERTIAYAEKEAGGGEPSTRSLFTMDAAVFRLMDRLGFRVSEAASLRLSRLAVVGGELQVRVAKKGHKNQVYPLTGIVRDVFDRWLMVRRDFRPAEGHDDYVFILPKTGRCVTRNQISYRLRADALAAGVDPLEATHLSPHALRRNRARVMLASGWHIASVKSVLDHQSLCTTQTYVDESDADRMETLRAVSAYVPLPPFCRNPYTRITLDKIPPDGSRS
jgi:site-specific recombinase XerD